MNYKAMILGAILAMTSLPAWATCPHGYTNGHCPPKPPPTTPPQLPPSNHTQNQNQNQSQSQQANANSNAHSYSSTGDSYSGGNSQGTSVNLRDDSATVYQDNSRFVVQAQIPVNQSVSLANANLIYDKDQTCGPLQKLVREVIYGTYHGLFRTKQVPLGYDERLEPYTTPDGLVQDFRVGIDASGNKVYYGHMVLTSMATLGASGSRSLTVGGMSTGGAMVQAGGGASMGMQQQNHRLQLRSCVARIEAAYRPEPPRKAARKVVRKPARKAKVAQQKQARPYCEQLCRLGW